MDGLKEELIGKTLPEIKKISLERLEKINLGLIPYYAKQYSGIYQNLIFGELIDELEIQNSLEKAILREAESDYTKVLKGNGSKKIIIYPTDLQRPECFVYGVKNGLITSEQLSEVLFKSSLSQDDFLKKYYNPTLPQKLTQEFLNPKSKPHNPRSVI